VGSGGAGNGAVDAHELSVRIHQGTAAITGVHGCIGLHEGFQRNDVARSVVLEQVDVARFGADDPCGNRTGQVHGVANGQHPFAHAHIVAVAVRYSGQVLGIDLQQGQVGTGVAADHFALERAAVVQVYLDLIGTVDHVVVGHDIPIVADDDTA